MDDTLERRSLVAGGLAKALNASGSALVNAYDATAGLVSKAADAVTVLKPKGSVGPVFSRTAKLGGKNRLDLKIRDLEKILNSGKKNFKEFETKYDVFATILRDLSLLKKQIEQNKSGIEEKITGLSEQLMDLLEALSARQSTDGEGQSLPTINYVKREHEKIDYEKISNATQEAMKNFEKRLAAFLSVSRDTHHALRGGLDSNQSVNESTLSNISKQLSGISKALNTLFAATVNVGAQKTDYEKIANANREALHEFERRFVPLTAALRDIPSLIGRVEKNQASVEGKLSALSKHTVDMLSALKGLLAAGTTQSILFQKGGKADNSKQNLETIDYEKIADAGKSAMRDFEKLLVPLASALREIPTVVNRIENNQAGLEGKVSALSKQTGNIVSVLNSLLASGAGRSTQTGDYAKVNFETVDYEKIDDVVKSALRGIETTLKSVSAGPSAPRSNAPESNAAMEQKLDALSRQMGDVVAVLKNFLTLSQKAQSTGGIEKIDYEKIASVNKGILSGLENKLDSVSSLSDDISIVKTQTKDVQSAVEGKLTSLTAEVTTVKGALVHIIRFLMTMSPKR